MRIKTIICWLLCLCLAVGGVLPAAAASASAADMRLEKVEGTVKLENASGRKLSVRDGMKLYSGYTVKTEAKSYAYLMLDDEKAVKLDENSALEVRRDGKKLELLVTAGQIFFNVTAPLAKGESMNIRTSTMVTGIRGTAGYVSLLGEKSRLTILEGSAVMSLPDGSMPQVVAPATVGVATPSMTALETLSVADIPGFVAVELAGDPALARDVEAATGQSVADVLDGAPAKLQADQAASAALVAQNPPPVLNPTLVVVPVQIPVIPGVLNPVVPPSTPVVPPVVDPTPPTPGVTMGSVTLSVELRDNTKNALAVDSDTVVTLGMAEEGGVMQNVTVTVPAGASTGSTTIRDLALGAYSVSGPTAPTTIVSGGVAYSMDTSVTPASMEVLLTADNPDQTLGTMTCTYVRTADPVGSVKFSVSLVNENGAPIMPDADTTFVFALNGYADSITVSVPMKASTGETTVSLPAGVYSMSRQMTPSQTTVGGVVHNWEKTADTIDAMELLVQENMTTDSAHTYVYRSTVVTISTDITGMDLSKYLASYDTIVVDSQGSLTIAVDESVMLDAGKTLTMDGRLEVQGTLINRGTVNANDFGSNSIGTITNEGTFNVTNKFTSSGTFEAGAGSVTNIESQFDQDGTMTIAGSVNIEGGDDYLGNNSYRDNGWLSTDENATTTIQSGGVLTVNAYSTGSKGNSGLLNMGTIAVEADGQLINNGDYLNGIGDNTANATLINEGRVENNLYLCNYAGGITNNSATGVYDEHDGGLIDNRGTFINNGELVNRVPETTGYGADKYARIVNSGTLTNNGTYSGSDYGAGTVTGTGTFDGSNPLTTTP